MTRSGFYGLAWVFSLQWGLVPLTRSPFGEKFTDF